MSTPMMQQYNAIKSANPNALLLFRLGDFYECFGEDAVIASRVLGITLTGRGKDENRIDMAGVPYHALGQYLPKLVKAGHNVAIAEQTTEPVPGQIVEREITQIVTPATLMAEGFLADHENNYIACICLLSAKKPVWGLSFADLSTAEFKLAEYNSKSDEYIPQALVSEIERLRPTELIVPESLYELASRIFKCKLNKVLDRDFGLQDATRTLQKGFGVLNLKGFGVQNFTAGIIAAGAIYRYLTENQKGKIEHFKSLAILNHGETMILDQASLRNLELIYSTNPDGFTLFEALNECSCAMGERKLRQWIYRPLISKNSIIFRQQAVKALYDNFELTTQVREAINALPDIERLLAKLGTKSANARDLLFLARGTRQATDAVNLLRQVLPNYLPEQQLLDELGEQVLSLIDKAIDDEVPITITEGGMVRPGYNAELDEIRNIKSDAKQLIASMQQREIERTKISSLKIKFNRVFGYYIEISKSNLNSVPSDYQRKQTLVNAERFVTPELKEFEAKFLSAEERANKIEYEIFEDVRFKVMSSLNKILQLADKIAEIDVYLNFAHIAWSRKYVAPNLLNDGATNIVGGRHPVVELKRQTGFIPNDVQFDKKNCILITGPNMSGKSTYIRQVAIIVLMAQIGSYVPAQSADIQIADRIFTRVGASDNLATGESTFMVEMNETANILNNATKDSLLILDEVGRGTSTYDGVAIAWSIVEFITQKIGARTLFATHYHELTQLEERNEKVCNYNVEVKEENGEVVFMHKIVKGSTNKSYGIHVASLAGVPKSVIKRANQLLRTLEKTQNAHLRANDVDQLSLETPQNIIESEVEKSLKNLDINKLTPVDALLELQRLKKLCND